MRRAFALVVASLAPALAVGQTTAVVGERQDGSSGWLVGRVCEDRDGDGVCGFAEPGIARARVVLSDGSFAVTDEQGRYHIAAVPTRRVEIQTAAPGRGAQRRGPRHLRADPGEAGPRLPGP